MLDHSCLIPYEQAMERIEGHLTLTRDRETTQLPPSSSASVKVASNHINKQHKESNSNTQADELSNNDIKHSHNNKHKKQTVDV